MALIFHQCMTPDWLAINGKPASGQTTAKSMGNTLLIHQTQAGLHRSLVHVKLHDFMALDKSDSGDLLRILKSTPLTFAIDLAFEHRYGVGEAAIRTGPPMSPVYVMLAESLKPKGNAIGFRIESVLENYSVPKKGPYCGVKGQVPSNGETLTPTSLDSGDECTTSTIFPQVFRILLKPSAGWGACYSSIDSGHLHVVDYQTPLNFTNQQVLLGLFSDADADDDHYNLNYIDVSIYKED